ncbi:MAG TPA: TIM-barrel domain-containing protein [Streptosporangiaceae bacterium]
MSQNPYQFLKVDDFFSGFHQWESLAEATGHSYDPASHTLAVTFTRGGGVPCALLLSVVHRDAFRVRFNPARREAADYPSGNSRSIVMDTMDELVGHLHASDPFRIDVQEGDGHIALVTSSADGSPFMRVVVTDQPFGIAVYGYDSATGDGYKVWQTAAPGIWFTPNGTDDFAVVQGVLQPQTAAYVGFGEHGGRSLVKNSEQLNFFNFDNFAYNQVYDQGPFQEREPLYHADPFFIELNGVPGRHSVCGVFVDNPAQVFMDIGLTDSGQCLFGTRYDDMDYYVFAGHEAGDIVARFTSMVGRSRLKPRYALGYHQGCYGYEDRGALEWAVARYRANAIPLDGLHVDVDIQQDYQTFTINEGRFPDPREMFAGLRASGVKCATNITPIISNKNPDYPSYKDGLAGAVFVLDTRVDADDPAARTYQQYGGGNPYQTSDPPDGSYNSGKPFTGEVNYGGNLGVTGHYPDLARKEVRQWWGTQYQYLFDTGLEMVWQDMTTPAIRDTRGDMKGFPFRLLVTSDWLSDVAPVTSPAVRVWNLYSYNLHKATYHGLNHLVGRENKRNFIVGRGSFTGMHRFAALWTGDNASTWDFLRINLSQVLAIGLSGQALSGQDIGGFARGEPDQGWVGPELLMRWTMAGAFLPWFRNHYVRKGQKQFQEPFQYVEWFQGCHQPLPDPPVYQMVLPVCRYYIGLRYRLLQLFYDAMFENTMTGMPICRPLCVTDPHDSALFTGKKAFLDNEFCVGADLLVAPVLDPQSVGGGKRDVYLPAGNDWYCFMDDRLPLDHPVPGGTTVAGFDASLGTDGDHIAFQVPIYVRAGAVIPTVGLEQFIGERNAGNLPNPVTLSIYPGPAGEYSMYLDDGISRSSAPAQEGGDEQAADEYRHTRITHSYLSPGHREIRVERIHDRYTPPFEKDFRIAILHDPAEPKGPSGPLSQLSVDGQQLTPLPGGTAAERAAALEASEVSAWYYDDLLNRSVIKVIDDRPFRLVQLSYLERSQ